MPVLRLNVTKFEKDSIVEAAMLYNGRPWLMAQFMRENFGCDDQHTYEIAVHEGLVTLPDDMPRFQAPERMNEVQVARGNPIIERNGRKYEVLPKGMQRRIDKPARKAAKVK